MLSVIFSEVSMMIFILPIGVFALMISFKANKHL